MKHHFYNSDTAIKPGITVEALCGKEIREVVLLAVWDDTPMAKFHRNSLNDCVKCLDRIGEGLLYAICSAESLRGKREME